MSLKKSLPYIKPKGYMVSSCNAHQQMIREVHPVSNTFSVISFDSVTSGLKIKREVKEMVHWNVENGQITPLQIAENINKMSKVLLKPLLMWGIN